MRNSESLMEKESRQSNAGRSNRGSFLPIPELCPTMCMSIMYVDMLYACSCIQRVERTVTEWHVKIIGEKNEEEKELKVLTRTAGLFALSQLTHMHSELIVQILFCIRRQEN
jgi:hypothetical protein